MTIKFGVPQGSILGPLLFIIFINDLPNISSLFSYLLFADDTNLIASHKSLNDLTSLINDEMIKISFWFQINKLAINLDKTNFIHFHPKKKLTPVNEIKIIINNVEINQKSSTKFLGIIIDQNLNWHEYMDILAHKMAKNLNILRHIKKYLNDKALAQLYFTMIHPYITYCNIIWGLNYKCNTEKIQIIQNKAIRATFANNGYANTNNLYTKVNILKLDSIHTFQTSIFMYKYLNKLLPPFFYLNKYFTIAKEIHSHHTRTRDQINKPYYSTNTRLFTIRCFGPTVWNNIPLALKNISNLNAFKKSLKTYLMSKQISKNTS